MINCIVIIILSYGAATDVFSWMCTWLMQLNPLIGPVLTNTTILAMQYEWSKVGHSTQSAIFDN